MSPLEESESTGPVPEPSWNAADQAQPDDHEAPAPAMDSLPAPAADALEISQPSAIFPETVSAAEPPIADQASTLTAGAGGEPVSPAPASISSLTAAVQSLEDTFGRKLDLLQKSFDRELRAEANRERVVERLHSELQDYKQDLLLKVQRPIFIDLIQLHDDIGKMIEASVTPLGQEESTSHLAMTLQSVQTAIEDILYRQGVEPFSLEGQMFDPRQQRAISTRATADPALNKQISARVRSGFRAGDKLIRPEIVSVFTYRTSV